MTAEDLKTKDRNANRKAPYSEAFKKFIATGWAPYSTTMPTRLPAADYTADRHSRISDAFRGTTLVFPAGELTVRSNDTDYVFRAHTAFAWYSGLGEDREPNAVLVVNPDATATLFMRPRAARDDEEFYANARYGEMWVGMRDSLEEMSSRIGLECRHLDELDEVLRGADKLAVVRDADPTMTAKVDGFRGGADHDTDTKLAQVSSEMRMTKDRFEISEMRRACDATRIGFEAVARELPNAVANGRGERWVEGIFALHARHLGNTVGYDTIAAGGNNANTLHWIRNDGALTNDDLLLMDAGVEVDSLYTADVTRTLPVGGTFSPTQRRVYEVVLAAQQAGIEACRPGAQFTDPHAAAIRVICEFFDELGILPVSVEESLGEDGGQHRRWMVHGTSHHLGMDVHDCGQARAEVYRMGTLAEGMIITVEPGIYFRADDELVPEEYRGIGVRIEDDILITADGYENLSAALPRDPDDVEAWIKKLQS